jgi:hypothetical protein
LSESIRDLTDRVGWVHRTGGDGRIGAGRLKVSNQEIALEVPLDDATGAALGVSSAWLSNSEPEVPERLVFVDNDGRVGLEGCRVRRSSHRMFSELTPWAEIHADYAVDIQGLDHDFWNLNGVRSEIAGLAAWTGLSSLNARVTRDDDELVKSVEVTANSPSSIEIGTDYGLMLVPHFTATDSRSNGTYLLKQRVYIQTFTAQPVPFDRHAEVHQCMQDLLTIAFGTGCGLSVESASSTRYPLTKPRTGKVVGEKWRDVVAVWDGRGNLDTPMELPSNTWPLFTLADIGVDGVRRWIEEIDEWTRVVGPLSSSRFQTAVVIELRVMQAAVSLEALGYRIALRSRKIEPGGSLHFPQYLRLVADSLDCDLASVLRGDPANGVARFDDFSSWADAFTGVYRQAKHADHPLPDPIRAWVLAESGSLLVRLWLAREFGVSAAELENNVH